MPVDTRGEGRAPVDDTTERHQRCALKAEACGLHLMLGLQGRAQTREEQQRGTCALQTARLIAASGKQADARLRDTAGRNVRSTCFVMYYAVELVNFLIFSVLFQ